MDRSIGCKEGIAYCDHPNPAASCREKLMSANLHKLRFLIADFALSSRNRGTGTGGSLRMTSIPSVLGCVSASHCEVFDDENVRAIDDATTGQALRMLFRIDRVLSFGMDGLANKSR